MKNLTLKKVAFGLLLAGYASSSAFAVLTTETVAPIHGNAPVLAKKSADVKSNDADHTVTLAITTDAAGETSIGANTPVKVGNYIKISYNLKDKDGDVDNQNIQKTVTFFVRQKDATGTFGDWKKINVLEGLTSTATKNVNGVSEGTIIFKINSEFSGADEIGFTLQEQTEFGLPNTNKWLNVSDIWSKVPPEVDDNQPVKPSEEKHGPGDIPDGTGPIIDDNYRVGIFKYNTDGNLDLTVNYTVKPATGDAPTPKYGEKYGAVVWEDANNNNLPDAGELVKTSSYTYTWTLSNDPAATADYQDAVTTETLTGTSNTTGTNDTIYLGSSDGTKNNNELYNTKYKAGAQGHLLKVTTDK
ncbi:hypothetical protein A9G09_07945 [Gilliamella sp. wkB292]|uniref:hypothetical protein n=1 Tax=Gilliamella sp. wkB292 TaxID=3120262 RepID=UPI00080E83CD|nr:hypothetical protein [Gilliamella apicola]OCG13123.1 hypothetical protein A9G09_07945 [Gilliamella apicola]